MLECVHFAASAFAVWLFEQMWRDRRKKIEQTVIRAAFEVLNVMPIYIVIHIPAVLHCFAATLLTYLASITVYPLSLNVDGVLQH